MSVTYGPNNYFNHVHIKPGAYEDTIHRKLKKYLWINESEWMSTKLQAFGRDYLIIDDKVNEAPLLDTA